MDHFHYRNGTLYAEDVSADELVERFGSPLYVYSRRTLEHHYDAIRQAFSELEPIICYSIKSSGNVHLCKLLADRGAGMDVVSGGELHRAKLAGARMEQVVYAGVGKTDAEIRAGIEAGIGWFNIESEQEFENIARIAAEMGKQARGALRINPDVDPETAHAKTTTGKKESKFGVDIDRARRFFRTYGGNEHLRLNALHLHIGSPVYLAQPYAEAIRRTLALIEELEAEGHAIEAIDIGGGYGADYQTDQSPPYEAYAGEIVPLLRDFKARGGKVILEPGRTVAANAGILLTQVQYVKQGGSKTFVIVDSGMHHMLRPTLYEAFHFIWPTQVRADHQPAQRTAEPALPDLQRVDVVGPICETGDYLALDRPMPAVERGRNLAVFAAGAYGIVMASHYNAMPKPAEVLVEGDQARLIRRRETYDDLVGPELNLD